MIFDGVLNIKSLADKTVFKEKIDILINTTKALCKRYHLSFCVDNSNPQSGLLDFGIITDETQMALLESLLTKDKVRELYKALCVINANYSVMKPFIQKYSNSEREAIQKKENKRKAPTLVDLFCGAGGLSLGFNQAGFKTIFANDFDPLCIETYRLNHPEISENRIVCGDIRQLSEKIKDYISEDVDIVIGGPPCQGFSSANKHHRVIDDPRNELYKYFIKVVKQLAPKIVVMENVKGMLKVANQVKEDFESIRIIKDSRKLTYSVHYQLLNSVDFSVAQSRERLIYIAIRNDISDLFNISPSYVFNQINDANKNKKHYLLSDALEGLRPLVAPHVMNVGEIDTEEGGRKIDANYYNGDENDYLRLINQDRSIPIVFNHKARYCSELNYEIYKRMNPGDDATDPKIADLMPYSHRNDKFKDKYYRLFADRPCRTITAHLRSDCHSHIHPSQNRAITPREAARVQSFPDDYLFMGPYLKTYTQIGNAVPVVMARGIAQVLIQYVGEKNW